MASSLAMVLCYVMAWLIATFLFYDSLHSNWNEKFE